MKRSFGEARRPPVTSRSSSARSASKSGIGRNTCTRARPSSGAGSVRLPVQLSPARMSSGAGNACAEKSFGLDLAGCATAGFRLSWGNFGDEVGVDDLRLEAAVRFATFTPAAVPGRYRTTFTPRVAGSLDVTCTWQGSLSDTVTVTSN